MANVSGKVSYDIIFEEYLYADHEDDYFDSENSSVNIISHEDVAKF